MLRHTKQTGRRFFRVPTRTFQDDRRQWLRLCGEKEFDNSEMLLAFTVRYPAVFAAATSTRQFAIAIAIPVSVANQETMHDFFSSASLSVS